MTVTSSSRAEDARLAVLVLAAEQMYDAQGPGAIEPIVDPRITANWTLRGYITGTDAIFRTFGKLALGKQRVFYGLVLESRATPCTFAAAIRGTSGIIEWIEDAEGLPIAGRFPGLVEAGFAGIGDTFAFRTPGGTDMPLPAALSAIVGGGSLTVIGHSLGSSLATYVAYDAAGVLPGRVGLRVFASPHSGNVAFVRAVATVVPDHVHYANVTDMVPKVPVYLGYAHLPNTIDLAPVSDTVKIKVNWGCAHHLLSYIALLDGDALTEATSPQNQPYLSCILNRAPTTV